MIGRHQHVETDALVPGLDGAYVVVVELLQLGVEREFMAELGRSKDYREGVAAFMAKRAPNFTGE